jgi:hypothetical protein
MYSTWRLIAHADKDDVQFLYGMQGRWGGWVFAWPVYADMICVYGFCDGNLVHAVAEYQKHFPSRTTRAISHIISTRAVYFMHQR